MAFEEDSANAEEKKDKNITGVGFKLEISVLPSAALSTVPTWPLQEFGSKNYIEYKVNFYVN